MEEADSGKNPKQRLLTDIGNFLIDIGIALRDPNVIKDMLKLVAVSESLDYATDSVNQVIAYDVNKAIKNMKGDENHE